MLINKKGDQKIFTLYIFIDKKKPDIMYNKVPVRLYYRYATAMFSSLPVNILAGAKNGA
jgi:hypothetical protein